MNWNEMSPSSAVRMDLREGEPSQFLSDANESGRTQNGFGGSGQGLGCELDVGELVSVRRGIHVKPSSPRSLKRLCGSVRVLD